MVGSVRPKVIVSKCLGFEHCRYNGEIIAAPFVQSLRSFVDFRQICPEVEIGLSVPRDPLRLVAVDGETRLVQPKTGRDFSVRMREFASAYLNSVVDADGFILKNRSPSCGIADVKVYAGAQKSGQLVKAAGLFGGVVVDRFGEIAVEDEGRLRSFRLREHFLTKLFALARFRIAREAGDIGSLVEFHSQNKLLLMSYNQRLQKKLGRIVANSQKAELPALFTAYQSDLFLALSHAPRCTSNVNVLFHALGYFSSDLSSGEKAHFLDFIEAYRTGQLPLSVGISLIRSWSIRFGQEYLLNQTFFAPYPRELVEVADSGKGGREC
jgi:uncharacterized protein YbgA (DUF1722 family)/uncharacterized protein YbbK (DUF523 family)